MTCHELEPKIAEFLAGELEERSAVEEHLLACADCRSAFSTARAGWEAASEWKVGGPSGDAVASTFAALEPAAPPRSALRILQAGTLAASLVIAVVIGTSNRQAPVVETPRPVAAVRTSTGLASLRPSVGQLFVQDENGRPAGELAIRRLSVTVDIRDGIARTEIEEIFENRTGRRLEGTFLFPLPPDASISRLAMEIEGRLMEGEVVEREKARRTYEGIVRSMKDPALLEWMPGGLFQCRIFPIEAMSEKRIVIAYTQALSVFDGRGQYVYPLAGESARELGIGRFEFTATVRAGAKVAGSGSPSHAAATIRLDDRTMRTTFAHSDFRPRADFVLAFETEAQGEIQVSAHRPEGAESGYFAAFITPKSDPEEDLRRDRKLFFLVDASGSVARAELEAARTVVRRMVETLGPSDRFRVGWHNLFVNSMADDVAPDEEGKRAAERFLAGIAPAGAGDFASSLEFVLARVTDNGEVVYVGEGTPTWGEKDPAKIVARLREAIGTRRITIRTVAVGSDAERGLLETVSREFNGGAHAISPSDDVHARAGEIARTLGRSALSGVKIEFKGAVTDAAPANPGSIHFGERLLVTGRYGAGPVTLVLTGRVHDRTIQREYSLVLPEREAGNHHVKRLWAQRRLADLVAQGEAKKAEAVKLSVEHQVMTPYTSFLVLENEKAYQEHQIERTRKAGDQVKDPADGKDRDTVRRKLEQRRGLELLFSQAQAHFERGQYGQCVDVCDRILSIDGRLSSVDEMKQIAQRLGHVKADPQLTRKYIQEWRRTFEKVELVGVVRADELSIPAREMWHEAVRDRRPKGILGADDWTETRGTPDLDGDGIRIAGALSLDDINPAFLTVPGREFATFIDLDGGGGPLAVSSPGITGTFGNAPRDVPLLGDLPTIDYLYWQARTPGGAPSTADADIQFARGLAAADPLPPQLFGINQSVSIPEDPTSQLLSLLVEGPEPMSDWGSDASGVLQLPTEGGLPRMVRNAPSDMRMDGYYPPRLPGTSRPPANNQRLTATQDLQYQRQELDRLSRDPSARESDVQATARRVSELEQIVAQQSGQSGQPHYIRPAMAITGTVTAVASELDLVVISIGRDAGVNEGNEFTILRGEIYVCTIVIDRVDRQWSSGRATKKGNLDPRNGDAAVAPPLPPALQVASVSADIVTLSGREAKHLPKSSVVVLARQGKFVAALHVTEISGSTAQARVATGLRATAIEPGDLAIRISTYAELWSVLPESIRKDIVSARALAAARHKLRVLRFAGGAR